MLCNAGRLESILSEEGMRRVSRDHVERYRLESLEEYADAPSPRQAGVEAGIYDLDDR